MNYKDSSYYRSFRFSMITLCLVLLFLGVIVVTLSTRAYKNSELDSLKSTGDLFINCLKDEFNESGEISTEDIQRLHYRFTSVNKLKILIYNKEGECVFSSVDYDSKEFEDEKAFMKIHPEPNEDEKKPLSNTIKKAIDGKKRRYLELEKTSFSKNEPYLLYGARTYLSSKENDENEGKMYILFCGKTKRINVFMMKVTALYLGFALLGAYLSFLILRKRVKKLAAYEFDFLKVCEMYAKGDFSEKISTDVEGIPREISEYVNALAADVENSEQTSKTFIANVSHELRTPMTTISGFVSGILDGTIPKNKQNEYLVLVSKEMQRLRILISSMLNMTRYESGTLVPNFKETNLTDLVIQTVLMFEKRIEDKHLRVEGLDSERLVAVVDQDLMQQVIYNIVENAVKFVNDCGTLTFTFDKNESVYIIGIRNSGEGLTEEEIQQVFDRFYKTDSSRGKDATGLGLGLSISRKIVHLHNGHIIVKSIHGEYTEFQIQIPDLSSDKDHKKKKQSEDRPDTMKDDQHELNEAMPEMRKEYEKEDLPEIMKDQEKETLPEFKEDILENDEQG